MPPKKGKGRKRTSSEEEEKNKEISTTKSGNIDLLSPSEVVKMRKKTRTASIAETIDEPPKESRTNKLTRVIERGVKREKIKEQDKKKEIISTKKTKKDKVEKEKENENKTKPIKRQVKKKPRGDFDTTNPVMYPCGICMKEVSDTDEAILCEAGCEYWYHRNCTGMTDIAYELLTNEENAEWVCDKCIATKSVPLIKIKTVEIVPAT